MIPTLKGGEFSSRHRQGYYQPEYTPLWFVWKKVRFDVLYTVQKLWASFLVSCYDYWLLGHRDHLFAGRMF